MPILPNFLPVVFAPPRPASAARPPRLVARIRPTDRNDPTSPHPRRPTPERRHAPPCATDIFSPPRPARPLRRTATPAPRNLRPASKSPLRSLAPQPQPIFSARPSSSSCAGRGSCRSQLPRRVFSNSLLPSVSLFRVGWAGSGCLFFPLAFRHGLPVYYEDKVNFIRTTVVVGSVHKLITLRRWSERSYWRRFGVGGRVLISLRVNVNKC